MKKIFLVYGHYNDKSFNAAIRDTFVKTAEAKGNKVDSVDLYKEKFNYSNNKEINNKLIIGSALFGAGWGLGGLCPGPAISSLALLNINSIIFVFAMFVGFYLVKFFNLSKTS